MTVVCDFCSKRADRHDDQIFIAAPSKIAHICDECVEDCVTAIAAAREQDRIESLCGPA